MNQTTVNVNDGNQVATSISNYLNSYGTNFKPVFAMLDQNPRQRNNFSILIEQGQFFTQDALCQWLVDCVRPNPTAKIADLTCGKGSLFNHMPMEANLYGCEIDPKSFAIARYLFDEANLQLGDIRTYDPGVRFSLIVGNPPYNLHTKYKGKNMLSQRLYLLKAAELLLPGGLLAVIVPQTYIGDSTSKVQMKEIYSLYNHVVQVQLDQNAFAWLGVRNFPTKLVILQRKADCLPDVPYSPELITETDSEKIYKQYVFPVLARLERFAPKLALLARRESGAKDELYRKFRNYLFQIKKHPRTRPHHPEMAELVELYRTQKRPEDMDYDEWERVRIRSRDVLKRLARCLREQNKVERDEISLVKGKNKFYYKAYSDNVTAKAHALNVQIKMKKLGQLIPYGNARDFAALAPYHKFLRRKQRRHRQQITPFSQMQEDPDIYQWLENWELTGLTDDFEVSKVKLNALQLHDTNLSLQKQYSLLDWAPGAGKTVSGTAQGMYRLAHGQADYVFVVSTAIAIEGTWAPFMEMYGIPHTVIRKKSDLRRFFPGEFVLITLGRVKNYKKHIKKTVRLSNRRVHLIYDESHNSSSLESNPEESRLTKAMADCFIRLDYKLFMTGTPILNNVTEFYPQAWLLYNSSCNMLSMAKTIYYSDEDDSIRDRDNPYYSQQYPPYMEGMRLFQHSHLPIKLTVFGVVKKTPDLYNGAVLREIVQYTNITRTFEEVTGKRLENRVEILATMTEDEQALYDIAQYRFFELEAAYNKSKNRSERKNAQLRIMEQIDIMRRICSYAPNVKKYTGGPITGKMEAVFEKIEHIPGRVAIGARWVGTAQAYAAAARKRFPNRPVFLVTGSLNAMDRRAKIYGEFEDFPDSILVCTQQALSESMSIDSVDHCFLADMHWNFSKMAQFYLRFIRYISTRFKYIYFVNYADSIETNLLYLLVSKERMLRFLKGQDISFNELFADMGFDLEEHNNVMVKQQDEKGRVELVWGKSQIAA